MICKNIASRRETASNRHLFPVASLLKTPEDHVACEEFTKEFTKKHENCSDKPGSEETEAGAALYEIEEGCDVTPRKRHPDKACPTDEDREAWAAARHGSERVVQFLLQGCRVVIVRVDDLPDSARTRAEPNCRALLRWEFHVEVEAAGDGCLRGGTPAVHAYEAYVRAARSKPRLRRTAVDGVLRQRHPEPRRLRIGSEQRQNNALGLVFMVFRPPVFSIVKQQEIRS